MIPLNSERLLGIVFITLRLCHIIDWGWFWIAAPFWVPIWITVMMKAMELIWMHTEENDEEWDENGR